MTRFIGPGMPLIYDGPGCRHVFHTSTLVPQVPASFVAHVVMVSVIGTLAEDFDTVPYCTTPPAPSACPCAHPVRFAVQLQDAKRGTGAEDATPVGPLQLWIMVDALAALIVHGMAGHAVPRALTPAAHSVPTMRGRVRAVHCAGQVREKAVPTARLLVTLYT